MDKTNIITLNTDDYLPRWKWSDLALILAESLPAYQQPLMEHLLYTLKADAQGLSSEEVLSDILVAIRLATNKRMSLSHLESAANAS